MEAQTIKDQHDYYHSLHKLHQSISELTKSLSKWLNAISKIEDRHCSYVKKTENFIKQSLSSLIQIQNIILKKIDTYVHHFGTAKETLYSFSLPNILQYSETQWLSNNFSWTNHHNIGSYYIKTIDQFIPKIKTLEILPTNPWINPQIKNR